MTVTVRDITDDNLTRHGGAYDRGAADAWYGREYAPHYYKGDSYSSEKVEIERMTLLEKIAYHRGYTENQFNQKEWE